MTDQCEFYLPSGVRAPPGLPQADDEAFESAFMITAEEEDSDDDDALNTPKGGPGQGIQGAIGQFGSAKVAEPSSVPRNQWW